MLINQGQTIPCPVCKTGIPFDAQQLLQGVQFSCAACRAVISLAEESKGLVQKTLESFAEAKRKYGRPTEER